MHMPATTTYNATTTYTTPILRECPACRQPLMARVTVALETPDPGTIPAATEAGGATLTMQGTVVGLSVSHDCTPAVTRSPLEQVQTRRGRDPLPLTGDGLG